MLSAGRRAARAGTRAAVVGLLALVLPLTPTGAASAAVPARSAQTFPVRVTLDGRTATTLANHAAPDRYRAGTRVVVVCQAAGGETYGGSSVWDLTEDGLWIPDHFVGTGRSGFSPTVPRCVLPRAFTVSATLDGRTRKRLDDHARPNRYPAGSTVRVTCQAYGGPTYGGSTLWDRTADGYWIPDRYVRTGTDGLVPDLPRCDLDAGSGSGGAGSRRPASDLRFSLRGASFVAQYESLVPRPDEDPTGHCTVGYGHLVHRGACTRADLDAWGTVDRDRALAVLWSDVNRTAPGLRSALGGTPLHQHEFDALMSLAFNAGTGTFRATDVRADLVASPPRYAAVPEHLLSVVNGGGRPLCGLHRRRVDEGRIFRSAVYTRTYPACPPGYS